MAAKLIDLIDFMSWSFSTRFVDKMSHKTKGAIKAAVSRKGADSALPKCLMEIAW